MKRLFKFLVAAATSFSLLFANVPLTSIVVRADGDEQAVPEYTFTSQFVGQNPDEMREEITFSDGENVYYSGSDTVFAAGNINLSISNEQGTTIKTLQVRYDRESVPLYSTIEGGTYTVTSKFRIVNISSSVDENSDFKTAWVEIAYVEDPPQTDNNNQDENQEQASGYTFTNKFVGENPHEELQFINGNSFITGSSDARFAAGTINVAVSPDENATIKTLKITIREGDEDKVLYDSSNGTGSYTANADFKVVNISTTGSGNNLTGILEIVFVSDDQGPEQKPIYHVTLKSTVARNFIFNYPGDNGHPNYGQYQLEITGNGTTTYNNTFDIEGKPESFSLWQPSNIGAEGIRRLANVYINGKEVPVSARYDDCTFSLADIEGDTITIELVGDDVPGGVIEWTNYGCPADKRQHNISAEEQFEYGSAKVVGVYAENDTTFSKNIMADYGIDDSGCLYDEYNGCLRIENGYWIAFEFVPLPGYQLKTFGGGAPGQGGSLDISTGNSANVYYFQMPQGNCHFKATFVPEEDSFEDKSSVVAQGNIDLSDANLVGGSGLVTVTDNDGSAYAGRQWDNGLEAQECLNIDLDNRFLKANTSDYWSEEVHDLRNNGTATIALDLGEDFDPGKENVQIIHITDEGETEYLNTTYDAETHTIFFNTTGFSDFLIATTENEVPAAEVPEGFSAEVKNNDNDENNEEEPEYEPPHFSVALTDDDEPALGNWEGEENPFFVALRVGTAIPGDAIINNDLPEDLPEECKLIYFINGEEVESFSVTERKSFQPGHFVTYEGIKVTESTCEVYFNECWVVGIEVMQLDLSMKALDKDGKVIEPACGSDKDGALIFECGDAGEEDFTYFEIAYPVCPAEVAVKGINDYAIFYLECNEKDMFKTPIGENSIEYPSEDDYIWIGAWGMVTDTESVNFTDSLTKVSAVFEGVSEDKIDDYLLVVSEFDPSEASEEELAAIKKQIAEKGYDVSEFPLGFDITLYDKNGEVHEPGFTVRITLVLKKALDLKDGEKVLILHMLDDDNFEIIEAVYNATNLTLTFETKTFSPFVVMTGTKAAPASVVKTGETVNTTRIVIASLLIGAAAAAGILFIRRRESEIEKEEN